ncbi:hypothetical protein [Bradyrhizobium diazoefficiens]|uniref:hypothetical protein n=1 Tax=Bradyrhizobium diazoefficiens TaxID=1355477 RepID=UPI001B660B49|nr:hypothetical protein [Bradyrhizobium japonicum]
MPSKAELICVDPDRIFDFWRFARPLILAAIERTGLSEFASIENQVLSGEQLLWLAWDGSAILAAATTHLTRDVCTITACSGHDRKRWLPLIEQIENYAKAEGALRTRIIGRRGWERVLSAYRAQFVILEKDV